MENLIFSNSSPRLVSFQFSVSCSESLNGTTRMHEFCHTVCQVTKEWFLQEARLDGLEVRWSPYGRIFVNVPCHDLTILWKIGVFLGVYFDGGMLLCEVKCRLKEYDDVWELGLASYGVEMP